MGKRNHPRKGKAPSEADKKRSRQVLAVMAGTVLMLAALFVAARYAARRGLPPQDDHAHPAAPHGGAIVSVGDDEHHYHAELVLERAGRLTLYTLAADAGKVFEVASQVLTAEVRVEGEKDGRQLLLMPVPDRADTPAMTSRFVGKLPEGLRGKVVLVTVPVLTISGRRHRLEFTPAVAHDAMPAAADKDEQALYFTPGGLYTVADIQANGSMTAARKFKGVTSAHDVRPKPGDKVCPITRTKANPKFRWFVGGNSYEFCCPPCVDEFVKVAKERPHEIKAPSDYVQK